MRTRWFGYHLTDLLAINVADSAKKIILEHEPENINLFMSELKIGKLAIIGLPLLDELK